MVFFSQQMLNIAIELAQYNSWYERFALKFFEHTVLIAASMDKPGKHRAELWDEEDGFFYDVLRYPDGHATRLKVRSIVGLYLWLLLSSLKMTSGTICHHLKAKPFTSLIASKKHANSFTCLFIRDIKVVACYLFAMRKTAPHLEPII